VPDITEQQAQRLIAFASGRLGRVEGNGECWTLADNAFSHLGFHKPAATYAWGRVVEQVSGARPGDIFQFTRFTYRVDRSDGSWFEGSRGAPRHTAILESIDANGYATFLECNVDDALNPQDDRHNVQRNRFHVRTADINEDDGGRTTVRTSGSYIIYRPQAAD
jgi:hypothetical protein